MLQGKLFDSVRLSKFNKARFLDQMPVAGGSWRALLQAVPGNAAEEPHPWLVAAGSQAPSDITGQSCAKLRSLKSRICW